MNYPIRKALRFDLDRLPVAEQERFFQFAHARQRASWTLLTFSMPLLFIVGWWRDYSVFGSGARDMLLVRLALASLLLAAAVSMRLPGLRRFAGLLGVVYAFLFGTTIVVLTAIDPAKLSLTHVAIMLMLIIMLPHALRPAEARGMVLALCLPMFALLAWMHVMPGLWLAFSLFAVAGIAIGITYRNANLNSILDLFVHRQRLLRRLHTDALTALANRDGWDVHAARLHTPHAGTQRPLALLFLDLDHFKAINDSHGHAAGDELLRNVGAALRRSLRSDDLAARIGGEEFLILLPNTNAEAAMATAERLREAVATLPGKAPVTVSIGVTTVRVDEPMDTAIQRADQAMLQAKREGRNRVVRA